MNAKEKLKTMNQISLLIIMDVKSAGTALTLPRTRRRSATSRPCANWPPRCWRWIHLKAANGEIIAASQGYETKANAEKGIESVKTSAPAAKVVDLTERQPAHNLQA